MRLVSTTGREAFSLAVLLASIGTAWLTSLAGLSMAVGAFLAGLVLAESEVSHQVHAEVRPLRDLLASLFFISVGMLVDPRALAGQVPLLIGLAGDHSRREEHFRGRRPLPSPARRFGLRRRQASRSRRSASSRCFSAARARTAGLISDRDWQPLLGAAILTMMAAPGLVALAPAAGARVAGWRRRARQRRAARERALERPRRDSRDTAPEDASSLARCAISASRSSRSTSTAQTVQQAAAAGEPLVYADVTAPDALEGAGVAHAAAVVAVLSDPDATERAVRSIRTVSAIGADRRAHPVPSRGGAPAPRRRDRRGGRGDRGVVRGRRAAARAPGDPGQHRRGAARHLPPGDLCRTRRGARARRPSRSTRCPRS